MSTEHDTLDQGSSRTLVDTTGLAARLKEFAAARNWEQFHSPKNLVMALGNEVGELTEIFQWLTEEASRQAMSDPETARAIEGELADVLFYFVRLADVLGVDLNRAAHAKLALNERRYPVAKSYGTNRKYDKI